MKVTSERSYPVVSSLTITLGCLKFHDRFAFVSRDALGNPFASPKIENLATSQTPAAGLYSSKQGPPS